ncbi:hypothetical protein PRIPAC_88610, partial [Pristionchus pacificus]
ERATQMIPILRDSSQSALPTIPDDIIYQLIDCIGPIRFLHSGWERVSRGFSSILDRKLNLSRIFDFRSLLYDGIDISSPSTSNFCLSFIVSRLQNIEEAIIPMSILMRLVQSPDESLQFPPLKSLIILINEDDNHIIATSALSFRERKTAKEIPLFSSIDELSLEIEVNDDFNLSHAEFRQFASFFKQFCTEWNVRLMDNTSKGQGWCPPCEIYLKRESFFITYVRSLTYIGITLNRLKLEERKEDIKKNIHMHHEYKKCNHLYVLYTIGFTASAVEDTFPSLQSIIIKDQPHLMLHQYLSNAPCLSTIRMVKNSEELAASSII